MNHIEILEPIWKNKSVGIAERNLTGDIEVEILYRDKAGNKVFPGTYRMEKKKAKKYPQQIVGRGVCLRIIPICEFIHVPEKTDEEKEKEEALKYFG